MRPLHPPTLCALIHLAAAAIAPAAAVANQANRNIETIEVNGEQQSPYTADQLQSATKLGLSIKETPQSISVITDTQMNDFGMVDISSVLAGVTGVFVQKVETDRLYYTARGFDIVNFQMDGLGLPLAYGNNGGHTDTAIFERVEVVRGANGLTAGAGNPSATINMVRKRPTDTAQAKVAASTGSWNFNRLESDFAGPLGSAVRGRIVAALEDKDNYLDRHQQTKGVIYGSAEFDITASTLLTVGHTTQRTETDGTLWGALPLYYSDGSPTRFDVSTSTSADWTYWYFTEHNSFVEVQQALAGDWQLVATYQRERRTEESELFYVYGTPDATTGLGLKGWTSDYDVEEWQDLVDVHGNGSFSVGRQHELVFGASWAMFDHSALSTYDYTTDAGFPVLPPLQEWTGNTPRPVFRDFPPDTGVRDNGAELQDEQVSVYATTRLNMTDKLKTILGSRWDKWQSEGYSYAEPRQTSATHLTPYFGVTYDIHPTASGYASYTQAFTAQTETDASGKRLDPLQGENYEVGIKGALFDGKLNTTLALFKVAQRNLALPLPKDSPEEPQRFRTADAISKGIEVEAVGQAAPGLQLSVGYTWLDLTAPGDEGRLIEGYTPKQMLRAAATYEVPNVPRLKLGGSIQWQDETSRIEGAVAAGLPNEGEPIVTRQEAYALVSVLAAFEFSSSLTASLNLENVTDEKYLNSLYWPQGYYGAPRHGKFSLTWRI